MKSNRNWLSTIGGCLFGIAMINFGVFMSVAASIGGDAFNGKVEGPHYYVGGHGKYTEVSHRVWIYSRYHTISICITHPVGILIGGGLLSLGGKKQYEYRRIRRDRNVVRG